MCVGYKVSEIPRTREALPGAIPARDLKQRNMLLPNDILIRTTSEGATLWVSQRLVVECCGVSEGCIRYNRSTYKQSLPASWQKVAEGGDFMLGDTGKAWRWGRKGGQYYYDYDRIPDRAPVRYRSMLPRREELEAFVEENNLAQSRERRAALRNALTEAVARRIDNADARWIQTRSGFQVELAKCRDYARALAWCRMIVETVRLGRTEEFGATTVGAFYDSCAAVLAELRLSNLSVSTAASLRKKLAGFPEDVEEQRRWIISRKLGNNNRQIVGKHPVINYETGEIYKFDVHEAFMFMAYANFDGPQKESLRALYSEKYVPAINEAGELPVSERTFCRRLTSLPNRLRFDLFRHGEDYYKKHYLTYIPSEPLTWAHSLFCGDGSGLISYRYTARKYDREKGRWEEQTRTRNLYVVMITDVASGYIAGYGIAPEGSSEETFGSVQEAVRMAVEAGGRQTMFEFVSDNAPSFSKASSREWLASVFDRVRRIEAGNSQANPAEKYFRLFKNLVLRSCREFVRSSHNASIGGRANTDNLSVFDYPTYDEAIAVLRERIEVWNHRRCGDGTTPAERFAQKNPQCRPMEATRLRRIFGTKTELSVERMRGFVTPNGASATRMYEIPDYATTGAAIISRATGNGYDSRVRVIYDETGADLYSLDGRFIMTCPPVTKASTAHVETTPEQRQAREYLRARKAAEWEATQIAADELLRTSEYMAGYGYEEAVRLGARKSDINEAYETSIALTAADKKTAERARRTAERKEERAAEKTQEEESAKIQAGYRARQLRKFQAINNQTK